MGVRIGPTLDSSIYSIWDEILYHYDLSLDVCTNDLFKKNTIDNTSGYDSFSRVYDLSGNEYHLIQATKSLQPVRDDNRYTKYSGRKISRSISYQSYVIDGETTQRYMVSSSSSDQRLVFDSWTCYQVYQFDGHFRWDASANTRYTIFQPLASIDNNDVWNSNTGSGVTHYWQNSNSPPGSSVLTFRGYAYGNYYQLPQATGLSFDMSFTDSVVYDTSTYGVPAGQGSGNADHSRELRIVTTQVTSDTSTANMWIDNNRLSFTDSTISDPSTYTGREPSRLYGGRIAEVIMFSAAHDENTRLNVHQFLSKKWDIKLTL